MGIDWLKSTEDMRQILYRHVQPEMARMNLTLYSFLEKVTGHAPAGKDYDGNMRSGKYARKSALLIFNWLQETNPAAANAVEQEIAKIDENIDGAWNKLLELERNSIHILPYDSHALGAAGFPSLVPTHEIKRGKPFYFRFANESDGFAIGFQRQNNIWLSLPLDRAVNPVPVSAGVIELPKQQDGKNIDPIAEEKARDLLEFLIVVYTDENLEPPMPQPNEGALQRDDLDAFADKVIKACPKLYATSLLIT